MTQIAEEIDAKHSALLVDGLNLGEPTGPQLVLYDGGRTQPYEYGQIFYHPRVGEAFELHGLILTTYLDRGAERSGFGYPIGDEETDPAVVGGRMNRFEEGALRYDPISGVRWEGRDRPVAPTVTVKIADGIFVPLGPGGLMIFKQFAEAIVGPGFDNIITRIAALLPGIGLRRVFDSVSADDIQTLVAHAQQTDPAYSPPNLNNFLMIDCPVGFDAEPLADALCNLTGIVEYAYPTPPTSDPGVVGTTNRLFVKQLHLAPGTAGIGVRAAWQLGADGSGLKFVDVEQGWLLSHEDLRPLRIPQYGGINTPLSYFHGAAVLGEIVAMDNDKGVCGIAPAASATAMSYNFGDPFNSPASRHRLADAILAAQKLLSHGDVLLVEAQLEDKIGGHTVKVPVETDPAVFEAIRLATKNGVIVVEPAGNSDAALDLFVSPHGGRRLDRRVPEWDSGAIMVGGGASAFPHSRLRAPVSATNGSPSGYGNRVDCYSWVENVVTCGNQTSPTDPAGYFESPGFGGTSAAAPVIAGVCLLVQNLFEKLLPSRSSQRRLGPRRMRDVLTSIDNATAGASGAQIGVMPDLGKLIAHEFVVRGKSITGGVLGDPLPSPALSEGTWPAFQGHELVYIGRDWVLDWRPQTGDYSVKLIDRNPSPGTDPLSTTVCSGQWAGIRTGHKLVYLGYDRLLDWQPDVSRFRVWLINRAAGGAVDPLGTGVPQSDGVWADIDDKHELISLGDELVLDWNHSTSTYRLLRHDPTAVGATNPIPGPPISSGPWPWVQDQRLIAVGNDRVLQWGPDGTFRIKRYARENPADAFPGDAEVTGKWLGIKSGTGNLVYVGEDRILTWEKVNGHYRLWRYDRNVTTIKRATIKVHVRLFTDVLPLHTNIDEMVTNAQSFFGNYGIELTKESQEAIQPASTPDPHLQALFVDECKRSAGPTAEQVALFGNYSNRGKPVGPTELVVFVVRELLSGARGCAVHPPNRPGLAVSAREATPWTLAHEIAHVLGLDHRSPAVPNHIMNSGLSQSPQPMILPDDLDIILSSPLLQRP